MAERIPPEEEAKYPNLVASGYRKTSDRDAKYNCVAWAADWDTSIWWEPFSKNQRGRRYWPQGVPEGYYIENYMRAFATIGYQACETPDLEVGFDKIALFIDEEMGFFSHVAKQLPNGKWASKLGPGNDIVHNDLTAFHGNSKYGRPARFMRRPKSPIQIPSILDE